ncbi:bifunctional adenosylcobinamide kinase/adenosylcobinamide-phosphate guanylyltransferase [Priestia taiwanensis]|uniref:Adenosylcobinamide kinase n=1 Tax=Priestia taiwanensis TaxID=1347902 RepID=A0A917AI36_9BACI|nr:bifunctional adenosylcobinamide kinase/adenosylcobinamide-phosphate guanylyltransferase [Priestia taiwanensis]MBM7361591.1 adenosylcobinamide kinase/adenosylcobinamide-phosphate guanylyltransferase [Priestia taiwanensis]GGE55348.1 adenosylcobinamide kinase/adenosylcobinamide phosphate guanyltransferase [Priestia taiwanensis]
MLIFISGAVRSGKSTFAESFVKNYATEAKYIATSIRIDDEMSDRIVHHQKQRAEGDIKWQTWEQPCNLTELTFHEDDVVLLDCLTILTANELFHDDEDALARIYKGVSHVKTQCKLLIVVSNEVFQEGIPEDEMTREYMYVLGKLHQQLVQDADEAYLVVHGIATKMKG